MSDWDAIVCGGSFAGLAAAGQIGGRVLVIDRLEIGDGETSASAVPLRCLERLDLLDCVDQVHRDIWLHTRRRSQRMRFFDFATFDYRRLCRAMYARSGAEFLRTRITEAGEGGGPHRRRDVHRADRDRGRRVADVGAEGQARQGAAASQELRGGGAPAVPR